MILALVLLALSAVGITHPKVNLQSLGLAFWLLALLLPPTTP